MSKSKKKIASLLASLLLVSTFLAACGSSESGTDSNTAPNNASQTETETPASEVEESAEEPAERTVTDAMGHEVTIPANPQRILATYLEDNLVALGVTPVAQWSVANGIQDYLQGSLKDVPTIPHDLPFEQVASFEPDLIILDSADMASGDKYEQYSKIAPTYVIGSEQNNDWRDELLKIGEVLGKEEDAQKALDDYDAKAAEAKAALSEAAPGESAAAIWLVSDQFYMVSEDLSSGTVMYDDLGLAVPEVVKEISATGTGNWLPISLEKLAELDADHLFLINSDKGAGGEALNDPLWKNIPAVKNGNVYEFSADTSWLYTGTVANTQIVDSIVESITK
ncbi:iron-hydroxamate ABC transporter substrate-binding protein [Paenibacillus sp. PDC88]|uniref:iron-hydroxamate ABC transporter substrate-binding protein n=1 Tax=Paenibacillus sp. PDC88 TaxID=1884375 RepID=UPI000896361D|nr:iron-hydroxamate ABC transporter substrate-binding protein [Paenibacillus sp. PDC88]SDW08414.1 iron complex transport system substrate-binding protein [Paenibacillus sp. PDC88]